MVKFVDIKLNSGFSLLKKVKVCSSWWSKARGLIFCRQQALLFLFNKPQIISLHMVGVVFPIDVILLDRNNKVIQIKQSLRPFHFFYSNDIASKVLEVPSSFEVLKNIKEGDILKISTTYK